MIRAQQISINPLKQMLTKLLLKKKKPKTKGSSSKGKGHEGKDSNAEDFDSGNANFENLETLPEEKEDSKAENDHSKRMG